MTSYDGDKYKTDCNGRKYVRYDWIHTRPIPVIDYETKEAEKLMKQQKPVVIRNSGLVSSATHWTLDYLQHNIGSEENNVYVSKTDEFIFYDAKRITPKLKNFTLPNEHLKLKFSEFVDRMRGWKPGDDKIYLQQMLTDTVTPNIMRDFKKFNWSWLRELENKLNWSGLTSNLLLIGQPGNITPVHYDMQQNMFAQVHGYKRILLFHPKYFTSLYPYPVHHPCDRQSQVDFEQPDYDRFPNLHDLKGYEIVLEPGDVLYIPLHWWHYVETTVDSGISTSVNFWYKDGGTKLGDLRFPLPWSNKLNIMRNMEKMIGDVLGDPNEVGEFLNTILAGRYDEDLKKKMVEEDE